MAVAVTHTKTLVSPDSGAEDKVYGSDYVSATSHSITGLGDAAEKNVGTAAGTVAAGDHLHTGVYEPAGVAAADITDSGAAGRDALMSSTQASARAAIGAGTSSFSGAYADLTGKPTLGALSDQDTVSDADWSGTDLAIGNGGTGQSTATAAFDALAPTTTQGDIIYHNGTDNVRLAKGTASQVLTMNSGATAPEWADAAAGSSSMDRGQLFGLTMSNAADTVNDITVAAGEARDEADSADMTLAGAITKQLDAGWAVGTNAGGLNTGTVAANTWYEVHLIKRTDTGVVDVMFTTTANRATLPTSYTKQRRIGWIRRNGTTILQFTQIGDYITLTTQINDASFTATATATAITLTAPPSTIARFRGAAEATTAVNTTNVTVFSEIVEGNVTPTETTGIASLGLNDIAGASAAHFELRVSATSTIEHDSDGATYTVDVSTYGWIDERLRLA